jgi:hypothetical protein
MVYIPAKDCPARADGTQMGGHASAGAGTSIHAPTLPASGTRALLFGGTRRSVVSQGTSAGRAGRNLSKPGAFEACTLTALSAATGCGATTGAANAVAIKVLATVFIATFSERPQAADI